jgi:phosphate-selective porin OprO/OprP
MTLRRACLLFLPLAVMSSPVAAKERLELGARVLVDADYYQSFWSSDDDNSNSELYLRNARVEMEYDFPAGWEAVLQVDAEANTDGNDVDLGTTYLRYTKWNFADITLGKMKEPLGMERNTSSAKLMTIEGAMMSRAFTPGKSWGVHLFHANKRRRWALAAVVEDDQDEDYDEDNPVALTGRFTWSPINTKQQTLQLGASASIRDWNKNTFRIRSRAEVDSADKVVRSAEFIADQQGVMGLEGVWRSGSLQVQGEYMLTRVEELNGPDWDYSGYYITGSYLLTGEQRKFKKGEFRSLKPRSASGAWELVTRYSYMDVRERGLGSKAAVYTIGLNYYYRRDLKLMLAFLHPDISGSARHDDPEGNAVSMRLQYLFAR